jgi:hypothetical protein
MRAELECAAQRRTFPTESRDMRVSKNVNVVKFSEAIPKNVDTQIIIGPECIRHSRCAEWIGVFNAWRDSKTLLNNGVGRRRDFGWCIDARTVMPINSGDRCGRFAIVNGRDLHRRHLSVFSATRPRATIIFGNADKNARSFGANQSICGSFCGNSGPIRNSTCDSRFSPQSLRRTSEGNGEDCDEYRSESCEGSADRFNRVAKNRLFAAILAVAVCMGIAAPGWNRYLDGRRRAGLALICLAFGVGFSGMLLLWLTIFPWSWQWWF